METQDGPEISNQPFGGSEDVDVDVPKLEELLTQDVWERISSWREQLGSTRYEGWKKISNTKWQQ